MNQHEQYIASLRKALDQSTNRLSYSVSERLASGRQQALSYATAHQTIADHSKYHALRLRVQHDVRFWLAAVAIVIACSIAGQSYWQHLNEDHSEIDIAILTDDLPIDVFVD